MINDKSILMMMNSVSKTNSKNILIADTLLADTDAISIALPFAKMSTELDRKIRSAVADLSLSLGF